MVGGANIGAAAALTAAALPVGAQARPFFDPAPVDAGIGAAGAIVLLGAGGRLSAVMINRGPARLGSALLERGPQLAAFAELLTEVRAGSSGRLVLVGGEAGAGKTAMLERFCHDIGSSSRVMR